MKKVLSILLAALFVLGTLTGCTAGQAEETPIPSAKVTFRRNSPILGIISEDDFYTNEFIGLSFKLPEGWEFALQEELDMMMGGSISAGFDENDDNALVEYSFNSTLYDMMASNPQTAESLVVMLINTARFSGGSDVGEKDYLSALKENLNADGEVYSFGETKEKSLGEMEYTVLEAELTGKSVYQSYYVRRVDKYMVCLCFTGREADLGATLGDNFTDGDTIH